MSTYTFALFESTVLSGALGCCRVELITIICLDCVGSPNAQATEWREGLDRPGRGHPDLAGIYQPGNMTIDARKKKKDLPCVDNDTSSDHRRAQIVMSYKTCWHSPIGNGPP